jgi:hypothetical protein
MRISIHAPYSFLALFTPSILVDFFFHTLISTLSSLNAFDTLFSFEIHSLSYSFLFHESLPNFIKRNTNKGGSLVPFVGHAMLAYR